MSIESERLKKFEDTSGGVTQRNLSIPKDLMFEPPKKSTVKLWIRSQSCFWNPENKVEYPYQFWRGWM